MRKGHQNRDTFKCKSKKLSKGWKILEEELMDADKERKRAYMAKYREAHRNEAAAYQAAG